ncbi:CPBP intramembrane metalloprotease-like protein [Elsinoe fawcettii]|nr:CPBP intramembrane metalloprotease-like protein [Elsinoe fawcettii]
MTLLAILFAGPLYEAGLVEGGWRYWFRWHVVKAELYDDWVGWRNFVVGPVSEEVMFRSLNVSLLLCAWTPAKRIVWEAPLLFGVAHLHHLNEFIIMHKGRGQSYFSAIVTPRIILPGIARTLFQLGFTTLFGAFVTFVFLRTGNVYSCILAHMFCNWMGFPRVWGRLGQDIGGGMAHAGHDKRSDEHELDELDSSGTRSSSSTHRTDTHQSKGLGAQWTVVYYVLLVGGMLGFWKLLMPLTESNNRIVHI